jgi:hypothetical protein
VSTVAAVVAAAVADAAIRLLLLAGGNVAVVARFAGLRVRFLNPLWAMSKLIA